MRLPRAVTGARKALTRSRMRRAGMSRTIGYKAKKRIYVRFGSLLKRMCLRERARGDASASIAINGFFAIGVRLKRGSTWVAALTHAERTELRALRTGIQRATRLQRVSGRRTADGAKRSAGVSRITTDAGVVRMFRSRPETRIRWNPKPVVFLKGQPSITPA